MKGKDLPPHPSKRRYPFSFKERRASLPIRATEIVSYRGRRDSPKLSNHSPYQGRDCSPKFDTRWQRNNSVSPNV